MQSLKLKLIFWFILCLIFGSCKEFEPYRLDLTESELSFLVFNEGDQFELFDVKKEDTLTFEITTKELYYDVNTDIYTKNTKGYNQTSILDAYCDSCVLFSDTCFYRKKCQYSVYLQKEQKGLRIGYSLDIEKSDEYRYFSSANLIENSKFNIQNIIVDNFEFDSVYIFEDSREQGIGGEAIFYISKKYGIIKIEDKKSHETLFKIVD